jgi:hypothetical protein
MLEASGLDSKIAIPAQVHEASFLLVHDLILAPGLSRQRVRSARPSWVDGCFPSCAVPSVNRTLRALGAAIWWIRHA